MKLKYYLRGLGVGMIVTTLLLMIAFAKHGSMSDEQVINRAKELGMVMKETESVLEKETEENTENKLALQENSQENETQEKNIVPSENGDTQTQENIEPEPPLETPQPQIIEITVTPGEYCRAISEDLASKGLVEDAETFRKYMGQIKYDELVCGGVYQIPMGASYEEIANILISGNN